MLDDRELSAVSPFNRLSAEKWPMVPVAPLVADCTLRDGEQQAGLVFTKADKVALARQLAQLGVHDLELGTPATSQEDRDAISEIAGLGLGPKLSALARATHGDIRMVKDCGVDAVRISYPISSRQRAAKTKVSDSEYVTSALEMTGFAKEQGLEVVFSPYDTTRGDPALLQQLLEAFAKEGTVDRVRIVDTAGCATPQAIAYLVNLMHEASGGIPIEVHCHNDFGLATANTIAGVLAGAEWVSVTVGGFGERSGNAALEEVVMALQLLYDIDLGLRTELLTGIARDVEERANVALQPHKAIVGRNAFAHETGMAVAGVLKDPFTAEAFVPALVGQERSIVIGKKSGRKALEYKLDALNIEVASESVAELLDQVKQTAIAQKRAVTDDELRELSASHGAPTGLQ